MATQEKFASMHVRVPAEDVARIDAYAQMLRKRNKMPCSRSAALRRALDLGLREGMRERQGSEAP
jgi:hypothetical protein